MCIVVKCQSIYCGCGNSEGICHIWLAVATMSLLYLLMVNHQHSVLYNVTCLLKSLLSA